jgi:hypothetical protein
MDYLKHIKKEKEKNQNAVKKMVFYIEEFRL